MTLLLAGCWLAITGLCDLARASHDVPSKPRRLIIVGVGAALWLGTLIWLPVGLGYGALLWVLLTAALGGWIWGGAEALTRRSQLWLTIAFGSFGAGLLVSLAGATALDGYVDWPADLNGLAFERWPLPDVVVAAGAVLLQLSTANLIVRLLLDAVGVPARAGEKKLKGGRLLGPMERLFIIGLGVVGQLTAAAIVVAAKGLLRFPEVQRDVSRTGTEGPSDLTEYFLIGSFASWLIALAGVALIYLE